MRHPSTFCKSEALFLLGTGTPHTPQYLTLTSVVVFNFCSNSHRKKDDDHHKHGNFYFYSFFLNLTCGFAVGSWQVPGPVKPGSGTRGHAELHSSLELREKNSTEIFKGDFLLFIMDLFLQEITTFF